MDRAVAVATSPASSLHANVAFATDGRAFVAYLICVAIAVAVFELVRGAADRRRIKVRRKG